MLEIDREARTLLHDAAPPSALRTCMKRSGQPDMAEAARRAALEGRITAEDAAWIAGEAEETIVL